MKKILTLLLSFVLCLSLCACDEKTSLEQRLDDAKATTKALEEAKVQERKNSVVVLEGFYGASPEWFADKSLEEIVSYFKDCLAYHERTYGKVMNAVIHFDEKVPHLACISPAVIHGDDGQNRLSARDIMGGRADYRRRQDEFYEQVGKLRGMERGETQDPERMREHLSNILRPGREALFRRRRRNATRLRR